MEAHRPEPEEHWQNRQFEESQKCDQPEPDIDYDADHQKENYLSDLNIPL